MNRASPGQAANPRRDCGASSGGMSMIDAASRGRPKGFTLIDLMVAVAVVAILSVIAYPGYTEAVRKMRRAEARAALMQLMQQEERYYSQTGSYMPFTSASTNANAMKFRWWIGASATGSAYEIKGAICGAGESTSTCIMLTATPGTANVNSSYRDPVCGSLILNSYGIKSTDPSTDSPKCW